MRFCTSELKTAIICRDLARRFPGQAILSVTGLRREESAQRARLAITAPQPKLTSVTYATSGLDWRPLLDWTRVDVPACHQVYDFPLHDAYTVYGSSRVSCAFCILASRPDLLAASRCPDNHALYRAMAQLEIASTFNFQGRTWLGDVAPDLLDGAQRAALATTKERAAIRVAAETRIPRHLRYTAGWPTAMPTLAEARRLAAVRRMVAEAVGITIGYTEADAIQDRYVALLAARPEPAPPSPLIRAAEELTAMLERNPPDVDVDVALRRMRQLPLFAGYDGGD
jgi:hypothetical protein